MGGSAGAFRSPSYAGRLAVVTNADSAQVCLRLSMADAGVRCLQVQDKVHDVLRNARAAVAVLDQRAADVSSVAEDGHSDSSTRLAGTVDVMTSNVDKIETCIEVRMMLILLSPVAIAF